MKRTERVIYRIARSLNNFFGFGMIRDILTEDPSFFGSDLEDKDDLSDSEFYLTEDIAILFTEEEAPVSDFVLISPKQMAG